MNGIFDCTDDAQRDAGLVAAIAAIARGGLVVMPTDTVYGVAADAFNPGAVSTLLAAKGRDRQMPPPVLVAGRDVLSALTAKLSPAVSALADAFWPGGLTIICWAQPSLAWDLGDTGGTVAIRVPDHPVALTLLRSCGPLAVSSANLSGEPPCATATAAREQLGSDVDVYLECGELDSTLPSAIVDATGSVPALVRAGAIGYYRLREAVPTLADHTEGAGDRSHDTTDRSHDPTAGDVVLTKDTAVPGAVDAQTDPAAGMFDAQQALLEQEMDQPRVPGAVDGPGR